MNNWKYVNSVASGLPNGTNANPALADASSTAASPVVFDVRGWQIATISGQFTKGSSTATFTIRRSADGQNPVALETAQTITLASPSTAAMDVNGIAYLHVICTTAESGVSAALYCFAEASE